MTMLTVRYTNGRSVRRTLQGTDLAVELMLARDDQRVLGWSAFGTAAELARDLAEIREA